MTKYRVCFTTYAYLDVEASTQAEAELLATIAVNEDSSKLVVDPAWILIDETQVTPQEEENHG